MNLQKLPPVLFEIVKSYLIMKCEDNFYKFIKSYMITKHEDDFPRILKVERCFKCSVLFYRRQTIFEHDRVGFICYFCQETYCSECVKNGDMKTCECCGNVNVCWKCISVCIICDHLYCFDCTQFNSENCKSCEN